MNPATIIALLQALAGLVPQIPAIVSGVETAVGLLKSGQPPDAAQQASIDAALEAAHAALQAS